MKCKFFKINELVSKEVFETFGETAFQFFDSKLLETIDFLRENLGRTMIINNYAMGGIFSQRGFRANSDKLVKEKTLKNELYCSAHCTGQAVDFDVTGMTAEQVREWIVKNEEKLPYPIRLEKNVSWVHLDTRDTGKKVYLFAA